MDVGCDRAPAKGVLAHRRRRVLRGSLRPRRTPGDTKDGAVWMWTATGRLRRASLPTGAGASFGDRCVHEEHQETRRTERCGCGLRPGACEGRPCPPAPARPSEIVASTKNTKRHEGRSGVDMGCDRAPAKGVLAYRHRRVLRGSLRPRRTPRDTKDGAVWIGAATERLRRASFPTGAGASFGDRCVHEEHQETRRTERCG
ncbi:MAG: hypothetical protein KatS3mg058_0734 [Roseiflexus sp.]|nr:MAG: hypothetical protein KatS3mg058_0734 [Roseiflexus sp.]